MDNIRPGLENAISARKILGSERMPIVISLEPECNYTHAAISPIISEGDTEGAVAILSKDDGVGENEVLLAKTVSMFLGDRLAV